VVCGYLAKLGFKNYLVEIGGEVRGQGTKKGALWRVGIDKPVDGNMSPGETLQAVIELEDKAIATSGNYRKFYVENGVKYSHHIDPRTGNISKNTLLSVTIMADECAMADGIATGCIVMGKEKAIDFINNHPQFNAYFVYSDSLGNFRSWFSPGLSEYISETGN
jgi:thiamine biosynthesis lipoprotein